ncbi:MAG: glycoside hydrolase family 2 TIM barrel-domain containing protein [Acidobacteriota bacterium]
MNRPAATIVKKISPATLAIALAVLLAALPSFGQYREREEALNQNRLPELMRGLSAERTILLDDIWFVQSSEKAKGAGEQISQPGFKLDGWYPAVVPSTVMGTLVQNNVYTDVLVGENLKAVPVEPFQVSWWYRREFVVPPGPAARRVRLEFDGINYRANVWLNGKQVADAASIYGAFRRFSIDVTGTAKPGDRNVLAVEVFPPRKGDFSIGFVDWNPQPPDNSMGLWREVRVRTIGDVSVSAPFVMTKLNLETLKEARLTVTAELENGSPKKVAGTLDVRIARLESRSGPSQGWRENPEERKGLIKFSVEMTLEPQEKRKVVLTPETHAELIIKEPSLWWTHDLGKPELYDLTIAFRPKIDKAQAEADAKAMAEKLAEEKRRARERGEEKEKERMEGPWGGGDRQRPPMMGRDMNADSRTVRFGIREVGTYVNEQGQRGFTLNGRRILVRGGGWVDDIFLDNRRSKLETEIAYARHMNLNALRLEGFWGTSESLYNLCDANGLLLMAGWSCQWEWEKLTGKPNDEFGCVKDPADIKLVADSWRDQVRWLRNHPSIFVWLEGSDTNPRPELEKEYIAILKEEDPTRPALISAKARTSALTGPSAVKMAGPYDYVPPVYWYADTENGGAFGFNTETGPGPQVPPLESLKKMFPGKDLWPINDVWTYHCARGNFFGLKRYNEAMDNRLGPAKTVEDYAAKAQFLNYEGMRAMFEAFVANRPKATGVIQWMYNSAWPKLWWQLYDYDLNPTGAMYGARKACEPLHLIYNYGTRAIVAVNNTLEPAPKLRAAIRVYDLDLKERYSKTVPLDLAADEVRTIDTLPGLEGVTAVYFLDLRIFKEKDELADANFYCLSAKPETLDTAKTQWYVTPVKDYADFTALAGLRPVKLDVRSKFSQSGERRKFTVELENPSRDLALQIELRVVRDGTSEVVAPIFLDDNYINLLPGEKRKIAGYFAAEDLRGEQAILKVRGWNVKEQ